MAGRSRAALAARKLNEKQYLWGGGWADKVKWQKYARCFACKHLFCCNNYADRKPRVKRFMGKIYCVNCDNPQGRQFIRMHAVLEVIAKGEGKKAKVARKIVEDWANFQHTAATKHLGRY